jgi:predicted dinucleotide-binding enzyme
MNITLIGTGNMGASFLKQLTRAGHQVRVTARHLDKARELANVHGATAVPVAEALGDSQVVVVATAYADAVPALKALGSLDGHIVIDITNPVTDDFMGLTIGHDTSAAEEIAKVLPGASVVKAFNTILAQVLAEGPTFANDQIAPVFYAGDDERAKQTVRALIESRGFKPVDAGGLTSARYLEPLAGLNIYSAYGVDHGTQIAPTWLNAPDGYYLLRHGHMGARALKRKQDHDIDTERRRTAGPHFRLRVVPASRHRKDRPVFGHGRLHDREWRARLAVAAGHRHRNWLCRQLA